MLLATSYRHFPHYLLLTTDYLLLTTFHRRFPLAANALERSVQEDRQARSTPDKGGKGAPGKTRGLGKEELREARERASALVTIEIAIAALTKGATVSHGYTH